MTGKIISHYKIIEKLGEGGNGIVYKAEDLNLKRIVALKFLSHSSSFDKNAKKRFMLEAQSASSLDHPNIYTIHEIGSIEDGNLYIAMSYYEGETLKDKIKKAKIKQDEAINIAVQICEGLNKAHRNNIIHRDIKPANIFITKDGVVKILDFGLAKIKKESHLTETEFTVGTVSYMSPEQAKGAEVDYKTDIWSLGIIIYEMLTGVLPFNAEYDQAVIYSILHKKPDLKGVPKEYVSTLKKALAKSLKDRYNNSEELKKDLISLKNLSRAEKFILSVRANRISLTTRLILILGLLISISTFLYLHSIRNSLITKLKHSKKIIAVLPFEDIGPPEDEYFAKGIAEEMTSKLSLIGEISVISSKSAEVFTNTNNSITEIGKELGANYILEGTIRWVKTQGNKSRIKIIPQLIRVSDNTISWSNSYDKLLDDIFSVQNDIAIKVVNQLSDSLVAPKVPVLETPTNNMGAYSYYLKGVDYENRWYIFKEDYLERIELFSKAIELDPKFALAYAHLSIAKSEMYTYYFSRKEKTIKDAYSFAQKAYQLNPKLADVYNAFAYYHLYCENNNDKSLKDFHKVLKIRPNDAGAYLMSGMIYRSLGEFKQAIKNLSKAYSLDPISVYPVFELAETYRLLREFKNAEKYYKLLIENHPELPFPKAQLAENYIDWKGDTKTAYQIINNLKAIDEDYYNYVYTVSVYTDVLNRNYDRAISKLMPLNKDTVNEQMGYTLKKLELGLIYKFKNDEKLSKSYFDSTRVQIEKMYRENPKDKRLHGKLGIAYAGLNNRKKALSEVQKGIDLNSVKSEGTQNSEILVGDENHIDMMQVYILLGDYKNAIQNIDFLLSIPGEFSVNKLKLDPIYDPLRNLPEYKNIIEKYSVKD